MENSIILVLPFLSEEATQNVLKVVTNLGVATKSDLKFGNRKRFGAKIVKGESQIIAGCLKVWFWLFSEES